MREKKKNTCSRIRILGNGMMAAGFLLGAVALGWMGDAGAGWREGPERWLGAAGMLLLIGGFVGKLIWWRCPRCRAHLMLCIRGREEKCPCCGRSLR